VYRPPQKPVGSLQTLSAKVMSSRDNQPEPNGSILADFVAGQIFLHWQHRSLGVCRGPIGFWGDLYAQIFAEFYLFYLILYLTFSKMISLSNTRHICLAPLRQAPLRQVYLILCGYMCHVVRMHMCLRTDHISADVLNILVNGKCIKSGVLDNGSQITAIHVDLFCQLHTPRPCTG
jgi:hypothetical protein